MESLRAEKDIREYLNEAECRVKFIRKMYLAKKIERGEDMPPAGYPCTKEQWVEKRKELLAQGLKSVLSKFPINLADPLDGMEYEYWEGVMAALRWVLGDERDFLDT